MKRNEHIIPLSREHHFGLLCSWKVREGVRLGIEYDRIKAYINFFWKERLSPHFNTEDVVFRNIDKEEKMLTMEQDHVEIENLITLINQSENYDLMIQFADLLQSHIRFEERELFPAIEKKLSEYELAAMGNQLIQLVIEGDEDYPDMFWKKSEN